jgi:hypothetical protein
MNPVKQRTYRFHPENLDPVTVYVEEHGPCSSRVTVQCWARAWTAYWGGHGDGPVEQFMLNCNPEYIADNLTWGLNGTLLRSAQKNDYAYVVRIATAIKEHFSEVTIKTGAAA